MAPIDREFLRENSRHKGILAEALKAGMVDMLPREMVRRGRRNLRTRSGGLCKVALLRKTVMVPVCLQKTLSYSQVNFLHG